MFKSFLLRYIKETGHAHGGHVFLRIKCVLAIFVEGHLVIISAKLFLILANGFRDVSSFLHRYIRETCHATLVAKFLTDQICFC